MQRKRIGFLGAAAGVLLGGLVAGTAGCVGADDSVSGGEEAELRGGFPVHRRHFGRDAGSPGGSVGGTADGGGAPVGGGGSTGSASGSTDSGVPAADCEVCAQAYRCCAAVQTDRAGCSFSAETCSSMTGAARPAYINACLTEVVSVRGAWSGSPPAECL